MPYFLLTPSFFPPSHALAAPAWPTASPTADIDPSTMESSNQDSSAKVAEKPTKDEDITKDDASSAASSNHEKEEKVKSGETKDSADAVSDDDEEDDAARKFRIDSGLLPFPEKLMALLDGNEVSEAMWWLPDGDAFCLIPSLFATAVLDQHFSGTKFESFTRKLNRW